MDHDGCVRNFIGLEALVVEKQKRTDLTLLTQMLMPLPESDPYIASVC